MCLDKDKFFLCVAAKAIFFKCPGPNFANYVGMHEKFMCNFTYYIHY